MEWIANPSVGDWLRDRLDAAFDSMHGVVPRGYAAYARVFHPAGVRSLPDGPVPTYDEWDALPGEEQTRLLAAFVDEPATWAQAAAAFGTTMHPLAEWERLVRTPPGHASNTRVSPDGREFWEPMGGELERSHLALLAEHLIAHTTTPDAGVAALWEGTGGLVGFLGHSPSRGFFGIGGDGGEDPNHQAMLNRSTHDPFNNVFRKHTWQEGILSREISEGPRLSLPERNHVLFSAPPRTFTDADWVLDVPWRDRIGEEHGLPPSAQGPSILWPDDRAWVMVTEVDDDSTIVAGSTALIQAICADDRLEALPIPSGAALGRGGDKVNHS